MSRKIVFIIVEGPSDDTALATFFTRIYNSKEVHVEITHGDITTKQQIEPNNIAAQIGNMVRKYAKLYSLSPSDFQEVIHLVDMDGAYISDDKVIMDDTHNKPYYGEAEIRTSNPSGIIRRNAQKRSIINRLIATKKVWNIIPYRLFYFSCNLDHVLHNKANSTDEAKEYDAYAFVRKYRNSLQEFIDFINKSDFSVHGDYAETWEYIKEENHSIERHTNLGVCLVPEWEHAQLENQEINSRQ